MVTQYLISTGNEYSITLLKRAKGGYVLPARMAGGGVGAYQLMTRYNGLCAVLRCAALDRGKDTSYRFKHYRLS